MDRFGKMFDHTRLQRSGEVRVGVWAEKISTEPKFWKVLEPVCLTLMGMYKKATYDVNTARAA